MSEDDSRENTSEQLDEILIKADWPQATDESLARLEIHWKEISQARLIREKRYRLMTWAASIAACLLIACWIWYSRPNPSSKSPVAKNKLEQTENLPSEDIDLVENEFIPPDYKIMLTGSRTPTVSEELFFRSSRQRQPNLSTEEEELLESAFAQIIQNPQADIDALAAPLLEHAPHYRQKLETTAQKRDRKTQKAAIILLSRLGSWRSIPLLMELNKDPQTHVEATRALANLSDPLTIGKLIAQEQSTPLKQDLLAALLSRRTVQSLAIYLHYVRSRATTQLALAALEDVPDPPIELLFQYINSPRQVERISAAKVLGRVKIPTVTKQLIQMALSGINRQEALVALLNSSNKEALGFLASASRHPSLVAAVQSARSQLQISYP